MSRILIVDDEKTYRRYLAHHLTREGHDVRSASTREEALEVGAEFAPHVLVLDWMLEGVCDLGVADALRERDPELKVILITGFRSGHARQQASEGSIARFLDKPFDLADLAAAVRAAVADSL